MEDPRRRKVVDNFCAIASGQAHIAYFFMSIHAVNPRLLTDFLDYDPGNILFANMLYGFGCFIFAKPAMQKLKVNYRLLFSAFGSFMFCTTSLLMYDKIYEALGHRRLWASIAGYFSGIMMFHNFSLYLYFVDICADPTRRRIEALDDIFQN